MTMTELALACRSYRRFTQEAVPEALLALMVENARISNSGMNAQPVRYAVVRDPALVAAMQPLVHFAAILPDGAGKPRAGEEPTAFIVICEEGRSAWTDIDIGIAARTMTLTACEGGFGSCMLANVDFPKVKELLALPEAWKPRLVLALGVPDHASCIVPVGEDGDVRYFINEDRDYFVPKRSGDEVTLWK